jgi:hypothetical protein
MGVVLSRAKKTCDEAFTLKLREELIPAAQLGGIDDTHCGDDTLQSASRAKKTSDDAFKMKLQRYFLLLSWAVLMTRTAVMLRPCLPRLGQSRQVTKQ